jgi:hypothetical protein
LLSDNLFYELVYSVAGVAVYSAIIYTGYRKSIRDHKRDHVFLSSLKEVVEELKHIIIKEEEPKMLDKGNYKNTRSHEMQQLTGQTVSTESLKGLFKKEVLNELTLTDLITIQPTDADYEEIIGLLKVLAQSTYAQYKFLIIKSPDEVEMPHFLQMVAPASENPELHKEIFAKAMNTNMDYIELVKRFAAEVVAGNILDLGDDIVVIVNDGTSSFATGVSNINNGLEGAEITFNISFIKKENLDAFNEKHFPKPVEAPQAPAQDSTNG